MKIGPLNKIPKKHTQQLFPSSKDHSESLFHIRDTWGKYMAQTLPEFDEALNHFNDSLGLVRNENEKGKGKKKGKGKEKNGTFET